MTCRLQVKKKEYLYATVQELIIFQPTKACTNPFKQTHSKLTEQQQKTEAKHTERLTERESIRERLVKNNCLRVKTLGREKVQSCNEFYFDSVWLR